MQPSEFARQIKAQAQIFINSVAWPVRHKALEQAIHELTLLKQDEELDIEEDE